MQLTCTLSKENKYIIIIIIIIIIIMLKSVSTLLPPANEVWGKVIFSQGFVCPQRGLPMGGSASRGLPRGIWGGCAKRGSAYRGVCIQRVVYIQRGLSGGVCIGLGWVDPPELEKRGVRILLECFLIIIELMVLLCFTRSGKLMLNNIVLLNLQSIK